MSTGRVEGVDMKKNLLLMIVFTVLGMISMSSAEVVANLEYDLWDEVLSQYVDDEGLTNYEGLLEDRKVFDQFISQIENTDINSLSIVEQKTFWINAYNAITMKVILDKYPVKDIRFVDFGLVWKKARAVAKGKTSLGDIEHKILRPQGDPRIHFAINCASGGCPKLPKSAFRPDQLDEQLDYETKRFINDHEKVRLDRTGPLPD